MKRLIILTASLLATTLGSFAQQKLWTWKPSTGGERVLHAAAMGADGSAVFVLGEAKSMEPPFGNYLLVWVSSKGKTLAEKRIPSGDTFESLLGLFGKQWEVSFSGTDKILAADSKSIRVFTLENGKVTGPKIVKQSGVLLFSKAEFTGWLEISGETGFYANGGDGALEYRRVEGIAAWKP